MSQITVVARSRAKPGREWELEAALRSVVAPTHAEQGCLKYTLHRGSQEPARFVVLERWASQADLDRHLSAPHILELFKKAPALVAEPPEIIVYEQLAEGEAGKGSLS